MMEGSVVGGEESAWQWLFQTCHFCSLYDLLDSRHDGNTSPKFNDVSQCKLITIQI